MTHEQAEFLQKWPLKKAEVFSLDTLYPLPHSLTSSLNHLNSLNTGK